MNIKLSMVFGFVGIIVAYCPISSAALAVTPVAKIVTIENGWHGEGLAIRLDSGGVSGCGSPLEFGVLSSHASYKDIVTIALTAQTTGTNVELVVDSGNCVFGGRTYLYSIRLKK